MKGRKPTEDTSEPGRFFSADIDVIPIIKGIKEYERCLIWHQESLKHKPRKEVREAIAAKLKELQE